MLFTLNNNLLYTYTSDEIDTNKQLVFGGLPDDIEDPERCEVLESFPISEKGSTISPGIVYIGLTDEFYISEITGATLIVNPNLLGYGLSISFVIQYTGNETAYLIIQIVAHQNVVIYPDTQYVRICDDEEDYDE